MSDLLLSCDGEFRKAIYLRGFNSPTAFVTRKLKSLVIDLILFYARLLASECEKETGSQTEKSPRGFHLELCHR